ncbi:hypothetical protein [Gordonia sp. (in: high G+C Gram-positive bacteria)]|uniref:hypothetical protein n=1 Tax=Gordonia sp. (in: high G+C Gram-positive bacteria) TaxID=84139 RepID=UPI0039E2272D
MAAEKAKEATWSLLATVLLVVRVFATIAVILSVIAWILSARNHGGLGPANVWFWPSIGSVIALLASTWFYGWIRARYPRDED